MVSLSRTIIESVRSIAGGLLDLAIPDICPACRAMPPAAAGLCEKCNLSLLKLVSLPYCPRCGTTLGANIAPRMDGCSACPHVLGRFARVVRLGPYAHPLKPLIRQLKYHRELSLPALGKLLAQAVAGQIPEERFDLVIPVPMHWWRRLGRGTDHARTLAIQLAGQLQLCVGRDLVRTRLTEPQVHLPRSRRIENVRGSFTVKDPKALDGAGVLLVDDVTTTGATADEAARTLLSAGASRVVLAVVAKSEPPTAYAQAGL